MMAPTRSRETTSLDEGMVPLTTSTNGPARPQSFLTSPITLVVTILRLGWIVSLYLPQFASIRASWIESRSLRSVLVRPHQTLSHLQEARAVQALSSRNMTGIYATNNTIRISPLVLKALDPILDTKHPAIWLGILLLVVDLCAALLLERLARRRLLDSDGNSRLVEEEKRQAVLPEVIRPPYSHIFPIYRDDTFVGAGVAAPRIAMSSIPAWMALLYYASPFVVLPAVLYTSWQNLVYMFLLASFYESCRRSGSASLATFYLSIAAYMEPFMCLFLIPVLGLKLSTLPSSSSDSTGKAAVAMSVILFCLWSASLQGLSCSLVGTSGAVQVLQASYGEAWLPTSPNLSLQWYFHMQIFSRFRAYFGTLFSAIPLVLVGPLTIRFFHYPEVLIAALTMIWTIYRPVQVMVDANMALVLLLLSPRSLARMGIAAFVALCCLLVPVILNVVDHWMWLVANNGNANYMFFQCLAYNIFVGIILAQFASASLQRDKALRIMETKEKEELNNT